MEVRGQLHALPLYLQGKSPSRHCIGDWGDSRAGMNIMEKIKISWSYRESNLDYSLTQSAA
jgi:hypothetical protein